MKRLENPYAMKKRKGVLLVLKRILLVFFSLLLIGCSNSKEEKTSYEETKAMVIDILHSDEGEKLITELLSEDEFKQQLLMNADFIKETIQTALVGEKAKEQWQELFKDQGFVASFTDSTKTQTEDIFKKLLNNPDFRKQLIDLFKDPSMQEELIELLKSTEFRSHIQEVIVSSLEEPDVLEQIKKAVEKEDDKKK